MRRTILIVILAALAGVGCQRSPTEPSPGRCRLYPARMQVVGTEVLYACEFEAGPAIACRAGVFGPTRSWRYASDADFLEEAGPPAHLFRKTWFEARSGALVGSSSRQTISWTSDAQKRPLRQEEIVEVSGGAITSTAIFTAWDSWGRPTRAEIADGAGARVVTIDYDEGRQGGTMRWSDGRSVVVDGNGNVVAETPPGGSEPTQYLILATGEFCRK